MSEDVPPIALLHGAVDAEVLRTTFLRGMLATCMKSKESHPNLEVLFELEDILLKTHRLRDISEQYRDKSVDDLLYAIVPANQVLAKIVECFR